MKGVSGENHGVIYVLRVVVPVGPIKRWILDPLRIPEYPAGHSDNIRPPKPEYPATLV